MDPAFPLLAAMLVLMVWLYQHLYESQGALGAAACAGADVGLATCMIVYLATMVGSSDRPFIYFQF